MGWWSKPKSNSDSPAVDSPAVATDDQALQDAHDVVATLLRTVGETALPGLERSQKEIRDIAERWAMHVLVSAPPPEGVPEAGGRRNWHNVRRFVATELDARLAAFDAVAADLRQVVHAFIRSVGNVAVEFDRTERVIGSELERLKQAANGDSIHTMREEVLAVARRVEAAIVDSKLKRAKELAELTERVGTLRAQLELTRKKAELDPLTQLANRRAFDDFLESTVDFARLTGEPESLLFIDVDWFKSVNDDHGHPAGDAALRMLADTMVRAFPRRGDLLARYGGEEFCVVLRDTTLENAGLLARRLVSQVRNIEVEHGESKFGITVSIGVATMLAGESADELVRRADAALLQAKRTGRDRAVLATGDEASVIRERTGNETPAGSSDAPASERQSHRSNKARRTSIRLRPSGSEPNRTPFLNRT